MRRCIVVSVVFTLITGSAAAQSTRTANTLKLDDPKDMPKAKVADIAWLAGYWHGSGLGGQCEEIWSAPAANTMMGCFRFMRNDKVVFYEMMTMVEENDSLVLKLKHFHPDLKGWEEKDKHVAFRLVKLGEKEAFFDGLTFRKQADGGLKVYLALKRGDTVREEVFDLRPAKAN